MPLPSFNWEDFGSLAQTLTVQNLVSKSVEKLAEEVPHIKFIYDNPVMNPIRTIFEASADFQEVFTQVGIEYLKSAKEINRCFNSETYSDLSARGSELIAADSTSPGEETIYKKSIIAHNRLMDLSEGLTSVHQEIVTRTPFFDQVEVYSHWQTSNESALKQEARMLTAQLESLTGDARTRPRARLTTIERILSTFSEDPVRERPVGALSLSSTAAITPAIPTVAGVAMVLGKISEFLLTHFLMRGLAFPVQLLGALTHTIGAIAVKILGSTGSQALSYFAAGVMRTFAALLPRIYTFGGVFSGAISFLAAYAPYIILAALIVVLLVKSGEPRLLGKNIYIFSMEGTEPSLFAGALSRSHEEDAVRRAMLSTATDLVEMAGGRNLSLIHAFTVDDENVPVAGFDITGGVVREFNPGELEAAIAPWLPHIAGGLRSLIFRS